MSRKTNFYRETRTRFTREGEIQEFRVVAIGAEGAVPAGCKPCEGPESDWQLTVAEEGS